MSANKKRLKKQKALARALVAYRLTPVVNPSAAETERLTNRLMGLRVEGAPYALNKLYFPAVAEVFKAAEALGYKWPIQAKGYPDGYTRLRDGDIEGVEHPIIFAHAVVQEYSYALADDATDLSRRYKRPLMIWSVVSAFSPTLADIKDNIAMMAAISADMELTIAAEKSPRHVKPLQEYITLPVYQAPNSPRSFAI